MTPEEYYQRALARGKKGDYDGAIADFTQAIALWGKDNLEAALAYAHRGAAHGMKDDYDGAIADCDKAIALWGVDSPEAAPAYTNRGFAHCIKGNHDDAIADCDKSLRLQPGNREAISYRAMAQMMKAGAKSQQELEKRLKESYEEPSKVLKDAAQAFEKDRGKFKEKIEIYTEKKKKYKQYFDRALIGVTVLSGIVFSLLIYDLVYSGIIARIIDAGYAVIFPAVMVFISLSATLTWGLRVLDARYHEAKIIALDYERKILVQDRITFYVGHPGKEELFGALFQQYMDHLMRQSPAEVAIALRNRDGGATDSTVIHNVADRTAERISPKGAS